ncbi:hypothetical protein KAR48_05135 [bacterium]|nr:hypothetical protein [bacterium]
MLKKNSLYVLLFVLICITGLYIQCNIDHGISPLPGELSVRIIFRNEAPANTQGIYLTVSPEFPPHAINEMFHSPNSLPIDKDTVWTEIALPFGSYEAVALWWYSTDTESNFADVLGLPLDLNNNLLPLGFTLSGEKPQYHMDLYVNWDRMKRDASISGKIQFSGPFPDNSMATAVAAYQYKPSSDIHYLLWLKSIDFSVGPQSPGFDASTLTYDYKLPVRHGLVNYIAVFWLPQNAGLTDFHVIGSYDLPLSINTNEERAGIDIITDWSLINNEGE